MSVVACPRSAVMTASQLLAAIVAGGAPLYGLHLEWNELDVGPALCRVPEIIASRQNASIWMRLWEAQLPTPSQQLAFRVSFAVIHSGQEAASGPNAGDWQKGEPMQLPVGNHGCCLFGAKDARCCSCSVPAPVGGWPHTCTSTAGFSVCRACMQLACVSGPATSTHTTPAICAAACPSGACSPGISQASHPTMSCCCKCQCQQRQRPRAESLEAAWSLFPRGPWATRHACSLAPFSGNFHAVHACWRERALSSSCLLSVLPVPNCCKCLLCRLGFERAAVYLWSKGFPSKRLPHSSGRAVEIEMEHVAAARLASTPSVATAMDDLQLRKYWEKRILAVLGGQLCCSWQAQEQHPDQPGQQEHHSLANALVALGLFVSSIVGELPCCGAADGRCCSARVSQSSG